MLLLVVVVVVVVGCGLWVVNKRMAVENMTDALNQIILMLFR